MKKILIGLVSGVMLLSSCSESLLDTNPTNAVSGTTIFQNTTSAAVALNGVYRALYLPNSTWFGTTGNTQQNFGIVSHNMVADLMGEDYVQHEQGNGWFYFDYKYDVARRYASSSWRCYGLWNFYYKIISNANYIIASEKVMAGSDADVKNVVGQALALRAYAYYYLTLFFQQTYVGNEDKPGVPLYTEPTTSTSQGKGRGTLREVYTQIDADLLKATDYLKTAAIAQAHKSNIDYYVAKGIQAKVFLTEEKFAEAAAAAKEARTKPGLGLTPTANLYDGFNNISLKSVMWGGEVIATEAVSGGWGTFFCHVDPGSTTAVINANGYGVASRKCIDSWLYSQIPTTDLRKAWWKGKLASDASSGPSCSFVQLKYKYKNVADFTGDYIFLRAEEMLLTEAEGECRQGHYSAARTLLLELGAVRDPQMAARLALRTDDKTYSTDTHTPPSTLMEEILFQRRVELWGEAGRWFDLKRLKLGFTRDYTGTNHSDKLASKDTKAGSVNFALPIPQSEFDGNKALDITKDQNPIQQ
jgi:SusD family.